jgi:hypothetical protein
MMSPLRAETNTPPGPTTSLIRCQECLTFDFPFCLLPWTVLVLPYTYAALNYLVLLVSELWKNMSVLNLAFSHL